MGEEEFVGIYTMISELAAKTGDFDLHAVARMKADEWRERAAIQERRAKMLEGLMQEIDPLGQG